MARQELEQTVEESRKVVADVALAALRRSLGERPAEIPSLLVDAIASGTGNRTSVLEATR
jgi:hypothetical protein